MIYGLNTTPNNLDGVTFSNVNISASSHMNLWYGSGIDLAGLTVNVPSGDAYANASPVTGATLTWAILDEADMRGAKVTEEQLQTIISGKNMKREP